MRSLLGRLEELETQRGILDEQRPADRARSALSEYAGRTLRRSRALGPGDGTVGSATQAERIELMGLLVERVEMQQKERGTCRLLFAATVPRSVVGLTSQMGVEEARNSTIVGFVPLRAGQSIRPRWLCPIVTPRGGRATGVACREI
jgi:hypothetical protein